MLKLDPDYYQLFDIAYTLDFSPQLEAQVQKKYFELSKESHPDQSVGRFILQPQGNFDSVLQNLEQMSQINQGYRILSQEHILEYWFEQGLRHQWLKPVVSGALNFGEHQEQYQELIEEWFDLQDQDIEGSDARDLSPVVVQLKLFSNKVLTLQHQIQEPMSLIRKQFETLVTDESRLQLIQQLREIFLNVKTLDSLLKQVHQRIIQVSGQSSS
jgi:hypothetical protein